MLKTTKLAKNSPLLIFKDTGIGNSRDSDCKNETVKKSLFKNLNRAISYLIPNAKKVFI